VPNISDAISDVLSPIILNNRVHVVSTGMPDRLLAVARRVSKGAHQVAHLPRGGKTAQMKVLVLACLTDFPAIHVSSPFKIAGSMGPLDSVDATDGLDHGILDLRVPRNIGVGALPEYWTYEYPGSAPDQFKYHAAAQVTRMRAKRALRFPIIMLSYSTSIARFTNPSWCCKYGCHASMDAMPVWMPCQYGCQMPVWIGAVPVGWSCKYRWACKYGWACKYLGSVFCEKHYELPLSTYRWILANP
jgi:hypothetical protein